MFLLPQDGPSFGFRGVEKEEEDEEETARLSDGKGEEKNEDDDDLVKCVLLSQAMGAEYAAIAPSSRVFVSSFPTNAVVVWCAAAMDHSPCSPLHEALPVIACTKEEEEEEEVACATAVEEEGEEVACGAFPLRFGEPDAARDVVPLRYVSGGVGRGGGGGGGGVSGQSSVSVMSRLNARFNGSERDGKTAPMDSVTTTCIKENGAVLNAI